MEPTNIGDVGRKLDGSTELGISGLSWSRCLAVYSQSNYLVFFFSLGIIQTWTQGKENIHCKLVYPYPRRKKTGNVLGSVCVLLLVLVFACARSAYKQRFKLRSHSDLIIICGGIIRGERVAVFR